MPRSPFPTFARPALAAPPAPARASATARALGYTEAEWAALLALRARYRQFGDRFDARERALLRFARWLVQTGRLRP